jgi:hypothetical protein
MPRQQLHHPKEPRHRARFEAGAEAEEDRIGEGDAEADDDSQDVDGQHQIGEGGSGDDHATA